MSLCAVPNCSNISPNNGKRGVRFGYITGLAARWARFKWQCTKHISATWLSLDEKYLTWPTNTSVTLSGSFSSATLWALSQSWLWTYLKHDLIGYISLTSKRERLIWKGVQCSLINFKRCAKNYSWETSARLLFTNYNKNWLGFFLWQKLQPIRTSVTDMVNQWKCKEKYRWPVQARENASVKVDVGFGASPFFLLHNHCINIIYK